VPVITQVGRFLDRAVNSKLPAVVQTTDSAIFNSPDSHRRAAVHTMLVDDPNRAISYAERDEILSENAYQFWRTIRRGDIRRQANRGPESPEHVAHGGSRTDATQIIIFLWAQHRMTRLTPMISTGFASEETSQIHVLLPMRTPSLTQNPNA
jgi:hypothetical protein